MATRLLLAGDGRPRNPGWRLLTRVQEHREQWGTVRHQAALALLRGDGLLLPTGLRLWTARPRMAHSNFF